MKEEAEVNQNFNEYLRGKRVALVGPANVVSGSSNGDYIDGFDIVIRLNKSFEISPDRYKDYGSRTDVLYHCLYPFDAKGGGKAIMDMPFIQKQSYKYIIGAFPYSGNMQRYINKFRNLNKQQTPFTLLDAAVHKQTHQGCKGKPNTGTVAIFDLLSRPIDELFITGITFFRTAYYKGYREGDHSLRQVQSKFSKDSHTCFKNQFQYFKDTAAKDERVVLDEYLSKEVSR